MFGVRVNDFDGFRGGAFPHYTGLAGGSRVPFQGLWDGVKWVRMHALPSKGHVITWKVGLLVEARESLAAKSNQAGMVI